MFLTHKKIHEYSYLRILGLGHSQVHKVKYKFGINETVSSQGIHKWNMKYLPVTVQTLW